MKRTSIIATLILLILTGHSQGKKEKNTLVCNGPQKLGLTVFVSIDGINQIERMKKSDILKSGFIVSINDPSFKIIGFKVFYDPIYNYQTLFDLGEKDISGNKVMPTQSFIQGVKVGGLLSVSCVNVEKNGKRFYLEGLNFSIY
jgi:hypothetical protein